MDLAFEDMHGSVLGLSRGRGQFLNLQGAPIILKGGFFWIFFFFMYNHSDSNHSTCIKQKLFFSRLMRVLRWLNNVSGVYLIEVFLLLIGQQGFFRFHQVLALASHWWRIVQILYANAEQNDQYSANHS
jgi:hypothetical protein